MKKILMLTHEFPPFCGGVGTYAKHLALAAHEIGHDITLVAPDYGENLNESDRRAYPFEVLRYRAGGYAVKNLPALLWRTWRWTSRAEFDIVHAVDWPYLLALAFLNKFKQIPFVATAYGTEILGLPDSKHARFLSGQNFFEKPNRIFAISESIKSLLLKQFPGVRQENVIVTLLGVDSDMFGPTRNENDIRKAYSIPKDHKIILTVSRLDERKGHRLVLKALARLPEEIKQKTTYLVAGGGGNGFYLKELHQLAGECGARVLFADTVPGDHLKALYKTSSVFCMPGEPHPKKIEGFGLVYLEAAAQGLPSIGSRLGGIPEVVLHEKTGLIIEPLDTAALSRALIKLLTDESYRQELGRASREHARTFSWTRCAEQTYGR